MSEYLSKEEIKQWRSSLEKITLEEFAARLGKKVEESKPSHDLADIVLKGQPVTSSDMDAKYQVRGEKLSAIAERAMNREKEISTTPFTIKNIEKTLEVTETPAKKTSTKKSTVSEKKTVEKKPVKRVTAKAETQIIFKKALTDREQRVFNYFFENKNQIVYAKDLALLLELPKDYVYKYIKNIRAKLEGGELQNAEQGGFLLSVD